MDLNFVSNPKAKGRKSRKKRGPKRHKGLASRKKRSNLRKRPHSKRPIRHIGGSMKKKAKRSRKHAHRRKGKGKNPQILKVAFMKRGAKGKHKTVASYKSRTINTPGEMMAMRAKARLLREHGSKIKGKKKRKTLRADLRRSRSKILSEADKRNRARAEVKTQKDFFLAENADGRTRVSNVYSFGKKKSGKHAKRKHAKRKHAKRKHAKRKHTKRKHAKRKSTKRTTRRLKRGKSRTATRFGKRSTTAKVRYAGRIARKHGKTFKTKKGRVRVYRNPGLLGGIMGKFPAIFNEQGLLGHTMMEAGSLLIGGAAFGTIDGLVGKLPFVGTVKTFLAKDPTGVGAAITPALMPMLVGILTYKFVPNKQVRTIAKGIISASMVAAGSLLAQKFVGTGLAGIVQLPMNGFQTYPQVGGYNYSPMSGVPQLGDADFGRRPSNADFGPGGYQQSRKFSPIDFGQEMGEEYGEKIYENQMG